jgi:HlyD family secretion protein
MSSIPMQRKKRWYKRPSVIMLVLLLIFAFGGGGLYASGAFKPSLTQYDYLKETVKVEKRTVSKTITTSGTIVPDYSEKILATGTVEDLPVSVGDDVNTDDTLLETNAQTVKAPFDGRVTAINTAEGATVSAVAPAMEFSYRSNHIEFFASENEVIDLKKDQKVTFTIPSYNNGKDEFEGVVSFVDIKKQEAAAASVGGSAETGYLVKVSMNELPEALRKVFGLTVDMTIKVGSIDNVAAVEAGAIQYTEDNKAFVYLPPTIDDAFAASATAASDITTLLKKQTVTVGFRGDSYVEITDGLDIGDSALLYVPQVKSSSPFGN